MIRVVPLYPKIDFAGVTHLIATSQTTLELLDVPPHIVTIAVGKKTAALAKGKVLVAEEECAEGVVEVLRGVEEGNLLYPHSVKARPLIGDYLRAHGYRFTAVPLYDIAYQALDPRPNPEEFQKIVFTSSSTVDAYFSYFGSIPKGIEVECIGSITRTHLNSQEMLS